MDEGGGGGGGGKLAPKDVDSMGVGDRGVVGDDVDWDEVLLLLESNEGVGDEVGWDEMLLLLERNGVVVDDEVGADGRYWELPGGGGGGGDTRPL